MLTHQNERRTSPYRDWTRRILIHLASTLALLAVLEGGALLWLRREPVSSEKPPSTRYRHLAERKHTQYDPLLGWVNIPNLAISNHYGEGKHLHINNLGFRGRDPVHPDALSTKRRIMLSGDSFTFGYGVGDENTWGIGLARLLGEVEVLNLSLGGYGVGQAYLRYMRDGVELAHDLHLFAFITEDFRRMTRPRFMGYGKPVVTVKNGQLVTENVPVPQPNAHGAPSRWQRAVQHLHMVRLLNTKLGQVRAQQSVRWAHAAEETARHLFLDLHRTHNELGRALVLIHLPVSTDYRGSDSDRWRTWLREHAALHDWHFIDLVEELRLLPKERIAGLFIKGSSIEYSGAEGHYTEAGNAWVAETLHRHLAAHDELGDLLRITAPL